MPRRSKRTQTGSDIRSFLTPTKTDLPNSSERVTKKSKHTHTTQLIDDYSSQSDPSSSDSDGSFLGLEALLSKDAQLDQATKMAKNEFEQVRRAMEQSHATSQDYSNVDRISQDLAELERSSQQRDARTNKFTASSSASSSGTTASTMVTPSPRVDDPQNPSILFNVSTILSQRLKLFSTFPTAYLSTDISQYPALQQWLDKHHNIPSMSSLVLDASPDFLLCLVKKHFRSNCQAAEPYLNDMLRFILHAMCLTHSRHTASKYFRCLFQLYSFIVQNMSVDNAQQWYFPSLDDILEIFHEYGANQALLEPDSSSSSSASVVWDSDQTLRYPSTNLGYLLKLIGFLHTHAEKTRFLCQPTDTSIMQDDSDTISKYMLVLTLVLIDPEAMSCLPDVHVCFLALFSQISKSIGDHKERVQWFNTQASNLLKHLLSHALLVDHVSMLVGDDNQLSLTDVPNYGCVLHAIKLLAMTVEPVPAMCHFLSVFIAQTLLHMLRFAKHFPITKKKREAWHRRCSQNAQLCTLDDEKERFKFYLEMITSISVSPSPGNLENTSPFTNKILNRKDGTNTEQKEWLLLWQKEQLVIFMILFELLIHQQRPKSQSNKAILQQKLREMASQIKENVLSDKSTINIQLKDLITCQVLANLSMFPPTHVQTKLSFGY